MSERTPDETRAWLDKMWLVLDSTVGQGIPPLSRQAVVELLKLARQAVDLEQHSGELQAQSAAMRLTIGNFIEHHKRCQDILTKQLLPEHSCKLCEDGKNSLASDAGQRILEELEQVKAEREALSAKNERLRDAINETRLFIDMALYKSAMNLLDAALASQESTDE